MQVSVVQKIVMIPRRLLEKRLCSSDIIFQYKANCVVLFPSVVLYSLFSFQVN